ncbi:unknown [Clostridium sp. CAG:448]|nr:unknown [Clostridium sp. CAG:448]
MHADRVYVFHTAYGNDIADCIAHGFKFDLFPTVNVALHQNLRNRGGVKPGFCDFRQLCGGFRNTAAGTAEGERRAHNHRVADCLRHVQCRFYGMGNF